MKAKGYTLGPKDVGFENVKKVNQVINEVQETFFVFICICSEGYEDTLTGKTVGSLLIEAFKNKLDKYPSRKARDHWFTFKVGHGFLRFFVL